MPGGGGRSRPGTGIACTAPITGAIGEKARKQGGGEQRDRMDDEHQVTSDNSAACGNLESTFAEAVRIAESIKMFFEGRWTLSSSHRSDRHAAENALVASMGRRRFSENRIRFPSKPGASESQNTTCRGCTRPVEKRD